MWVVILPFILMMVLTVCVSFSQSAQHFFLRNPVFFKSTYWFLGAFYSILACRYPLMHPDNIRFVSTRSSKHYWSLDILRNPSCPVDVLASCPLWWSILAQDPKIKPEFVAFLIEHLPQERKMLLRHPNCPTATKVADAISSF